MTLNAQPFSSIAGELQDSGNNAVACGQASESYSSDDLLQLVHVDEMWSLATW